MQKPSPLSQCPQYAGDAAAAEGDTGINENDTVATQEIRYGDNDRLGARVAEMTSADVLVLLSDVDGLYDGDPTLNAGATLIPEVRELTPAIEALAGASATEYGSGGMVTKLVAARICMNAGCATVIASGRRLFPLQAIEDGAACTWFLPARTPRQARKQWIAGTLVPRGSLTIVCGCRTSIARPQQPAAGRRGCGEWRFPVR
jgi:glutamate 5-kinase